MRDIVVHTRRNGLGHAPVHGPTRRFDTLDVAVRHMPLNPHVLPHPARSGSMAVKIELTWAISNT